MSNSKKYERAWAQNKVYEPHAVIVWPSPTTVAVKEYPYKEDAEAKYEEIVQMHQTVALAKIVKKHSEG